MEGEIAEASNQTGIWLVSISAFIGSIIGYFFNELIKFGFNDKLQKNQFERQLSMAALEKRLEVHQEAYLRWYRIYNLIGIKHSFGLTVYDSSELEALLEDANE